MIKLLKKKQKQLQQILKKKEQSVQQKVSMFYLPFFNSNCIIDNFYYL